MCLSKAENILEDQLDPGHHLPELLLYSTVQLYVPNIFDFRTSKVQSVSGEFSPVCHNPSFSAYLVFICLFDIKNPHYILFSFYRFRTFAHISEEAVLDAT